jgi:hypothetical protein
LAKKHAHKLAPARKAFAMALRAMFDDHALKLRARKQLQQLAEYATKYIHVEPSFGYGVLPRTVIPNQGSTAKTYFGQECFNINYFRSPVNLINR